ncbi:MAG TPA: TonB-dependent receptor plug domain-containing protein, partial [Chitinophagaceae bacterium]|nr:TonB-dependent receptor plug domain-containing protein [Chitinophagaceae bacterium]
MSQLLIASKNFRRKIVLQTLFTFLISVALAQEKITVSGKVTNGEIAFANVSVKVLHTSRGTTTNEQGEFKIIASKGQTILFSYIGYEEQTIVVSEAKEINVSLKPSADNALNDVVVVGYGTKRKINLTGAVSTVSSGQLEDRPVTNTASALQGTMPGVTVVENNGQPGKDQGIIRIRGIGTLNNSDAMVVVDGVVSSMNDVNVNDIESISVLKDAASAAIYGSRASNGVILITTKKGKTGGLVMHYNSYVGKQKATRLPDYLPSWQGAS